MLIERDEKSCAFKEGDRVTLEDFRGFSIKFTMFSWMIDCIGKTGVVVNTRNSGMLKFPCCKVKIHADLSVTWPADFCKLVNRWRPLIGDVVAVSRVPSDEAFTTRVLSQANHGTDYWHLEHIDGVFHTSELTPAQKRADETPDGRYELCNLVCESIDGSTTKVEAPEFDLGDAILAKPWESVERKGGMQKWFPTDEMRRHFGCHGYVLNLDSDPLIFFHGTGFRTHWPREYLEPAVVIGEPSTPPLKGTDRWDNPTTDPLQDMLDAIETYRGEAMGKVQAQLTDSDGIPIDMTGWYPLNSDRAEDGSMNCKYVMCEECPLRQQKDGDCQYERNWIHSWSGGERGRGDAIFQKLPPAWKPEERKYQTEHLRSMQKYKVVKKGRSVGTSYTPIRYQEGDWVYLHNAKDTKIPEGVVLQVLKVHDNGNLEVYHDGFSLNGHPSRFRPATKNEEKAAILKKSEDLAESYEKVREADKFVNVIYKGAKVAETTGIEFDHERKVISWPKPLVGIYKRNEKEEENAFCCYACRAEVPLELSKKIIKGESPCPLCHHDASKCPCGGTYYKGWDTRDGVMRDRCMRCGEWRQP